MATAGFGGTGGSAYSGYVITSGGIGLVGGRLCANGGTYAWMTELYAQVGGRSATRNVTLQLGGAAVNINVPSDSHPVAQYGGGVSWLFNGGAYNLVATPASTAHIVNFDRGGGGSTTTSGGSSFSGTIGGFYVYYLPPTAPQSLNATAHATSSGTITLTWAAPADNGGLSVTHYVIYRAGTAIATVASGTTSYNDTGRTPGTSYSYTVRARNGVTDAAGTQSVNSNSDSAVAPGAPNAPTGLTATASTSVTGRVDLSWTAPSVPNTAITGYNIFRDGVQIATTTGTGTTYPAVGLTPYTSYTFSVKARNAFADTTGTLSAESNTDTEAAPGPPGAPTALNAVADGGVPGKIDLSWVAPAVTGAGGITGYNVRFDNGTLINATSGTGVTYSATGLNPGQSYGFQVFARNALADAEGSQSVGSNIDYETALGEPTAPTSFTATASTVVANRITLSWVAPVGTLTGYNIFERVGSVDTLIDTIGNVLTYKIDGLTAGVSKSYVVRARNSYTDTLPTGYPGNWGGLAAGPASATPGTNTTQSVATLGAVTDTTNTTFNGTYVINAITPTTVRYAKVGANVGAVAVTAGTITDNTNATLNGSYPIATPTTTTFTYSKTATNIGSAAVSTGTVTNTTNASFNGTFTVGSVNVGAQTVTYPRIGTAVSTVVVPNNTPPGGQGTITNNTNAIFNGTDITIVSIPTANTLTYAKTNANISESNASGIITDTTNRDVFNGTYEVTGTPSYNTFTYDRTGTNTAALNIDSPYGEAYRDVSLAELDIEYRPGWIG